MKKTGAKKPRVYFDACCFIDVVAHEHHGSVENGREENVFYYKRLLKGCREDRLIICTSNATFYECLYTKKDNQHIINDDVKRLYKSLLFSPRFNILRVDIEGKLLMKQAEELNWDHKVGLKPFDLIHISSALLMRCDEFITTNASDFADHKKDQLAKLGLSVIEARETRVLPAEYLQTDIED